jgi:PIN domain nuclease of toxin-antitoxin system
LRLLLDTHIFLWWLRNDRRLPTAIASAIVDRKNEVLVSAVSIWEASIKTTLGKLDLVGDLVAEIEENGFSELPVTARHAWLAGALPRHHDDPFDRLLIAQARLESLALATVDPVFDAYGISRPDRVR